MTTPQSDETVLPTAVVSLAAQAADDVALAEVAMQAHVQSGGQTMDEVLASSAPAWKHAETRNDAAVAIAADLDLAPFHLKEGDTVLVSAVATDVFAGREVSSAGGGVESIAAHTVRSPVRRLRVIGEVDFASQLRRQLGAVRQNAIRIETQQHELMEDIAEQGIPEGSGIDRAQAQIGERIAAQRESILDIERLLRQNRLDDPQLSQLLQQSNDLLDAAGRAANRAVEAMEQAGRGGESPDDSDQGETGERIDSLKISQLRRLLGAYGVSEKEFFNGTVDERIAPWEHAHDACSDLMADLRALPPTVRDMLTQRFHLMVESAARVQNNPRATGGLTRRDTAAEWQMLTSRN
jgi:hypothetical protein